MSTKISGIITLKKWVLDAASYWISDNLVSREPIHKEVHLFLRTRTAGVELLSKIKECMGKDTKRISKSGVGGIHMKSKRRVVFNYASGDGEFVSSDWRDKVIYLIDRGGEWGEDFLQFFSHAKNYEELYYFYPFFAKPLIKAGPPLRWQPESEMN